MGNAFDTGIGVSPLAVAPVDMGNTTSLYSVIPQDLPIHDVLYS